MGNCSIGFTSAQNGTPYFISVEHRNAIETWSSAPLSFNSKYMNYDFTDFQIDYDLFGKASKIF